jgi:hypothetical protein
MNFDADMAISLRRIADSLDDYMEFALEGAKASRVAVAGLGSDAAGRKALEALDPLYAVVEEIIEARSIRRYYDR